MKKCVSHEPLSGTTEPFTYHFRFWVIFWWTKYPLAGLKTESDGNGWNLRWNLLKKCHQKRHASRGEQIYQDSLRQEGVAWQTWSDASKRVRPQRFYQKISHLHGSSLENFGWVIWIPETQMFAMASPDVSHPSKNPVALSWDWGCSPYQSVPDTFIEGVVRSNVRQVVYQINWWGNILGRGRFHFPWIAKPIDPTESCSWWEKNLPQIGED